ncbi:MAG: DUF418 domain-containing protein [Phocaeicola sp.]
MTNNEKEVSTNREGKKHRIHSIDALRGFALVGIMLFHCMEHFDLLHVPQLDSPFWQKIDTAVYDTLFFLFAGKAYAIFATLFGLSFYMLMHSQEKKGNDFRLRFVWRLVLLFGLGIINGMIYMGEFFMVYAVVGLFIIPLYKVPTKWLVLVSALLLLQIPALIEFSNLLSGGIENTPSSLKVLESELFAQSATIFETGTIKNIMIFNLTKGQVAKMLWIVNNFRYLQLIGLFIVGLLIGRAGIHQSKENMMHAATRFTFPAIRIFVGFYSIALLLPYLGIEGYALETGVTIFKNYANLGMLLFYFALFTRCYNNSAWGQKLLEPLAAVGRMSVTNYMMQSVIGVTLFYGFGFNLGVTASFLVCATVGVVVCLFQILISNYWIKRYYYGPIEWIWRCATFFTRYPLKRK